MKQIKIGSLDYQTECYQNAEDGNLKGKSSIFFFFTEETYKSFIENG